MKNKNIIPKWKSEFRLMYLEKLVEKNDPKSTKRLSRYLEHLLGKCYNEFPSSIFTIISHSKDYRISQILIDLYRRKLNEGYVPFRYSITKSIVENGGLDELLALCLDNLDTLTLKYLKWAPVSISQRNLLAEKAKNEGNAAFLEFLGWSPCNQEERYLWINMKINECLSEGSSFEFTPADDKEKALWIQMKRDYEDWLNPDNTLLCKSSYIENCFECGKKSLVWDNRAGQNKGYCLNCFEEFSGPFA